MQQSMNPLTPEIWDRGLEYADYRKRVEKNADVFDEVYDHPVYVEDDLKLLRRLPPLQVVVIGEDWCADVFHTMATWARVVEQLEGWSLRVFPRDQHLDLMETFLWKGRAQRIPVYAFFDQRGYLQAWWSGRGRTAQAELDGFLQGRTFAALDEDGKQSARRVLNDGYRREFRRTNFEEILALLRTFFHV